MAYKRTQENEFAPSTGEIPVEAVESVAEKFELDILTEPEAKSLLVALGVPVAQAKVAEDADAAVKAARQINFPVGLKGVARGLIHKSDIGAVRLNIPDVAAVRSAFVDIQEAIATKAPETKIEGCLVTEMALGGVVEAFVGTSWDPQHGACVLVGAGGIFVEIYRDFRMAAAPINREKAIKMIQGLQSFPLFDGSRGHPKADVLALAEIVSQVSLLAAHLGSRLQELDINPVIVKAAGEGAFVVDARAVWKS